LLESEIPFHPHGLMAHNEDPATLNAPAPDRCIARSNGGFAFSTAAAGASSVMSGNALAPAGGDQPHNNLQPYLTLNFCIALQGVYPPRT
jgi:microcystin-dependent protein